jgi:hypothetical protein
MQRRNTPVALLVGLSLALGAGHAAAQSTVSPYAGEQTRPIKSLSTAEVEGLLAGQGAGYAKAAELNGYPGPAHALELSEALHLDAAQANATASLMTAHKSRAQQLGAALVMAERHLDALFAERRAEPAAVEAATRDVGLLQAKLRAEHLNTHLSQTALLSAGQIERYAALRGYVVGTPSSAKESESPAGGHRHLHPKEKP